MQARFLILLALFALPGCLAQSRIQSKYMEDQDGCRDEAQQHVPAASKETNYMGAPSDPSVPLADRFRECMNHKGWHLPPPKPPTGSAGSQGQASTGTPPNPSSNAPASSGAASSAPSSNGANPASLPPAANPPTSPTYYTPAPAPAVYEPGRPPQVQGQENYGTGAGRQF